MCPCYTVVRIQPMPGDVVRLGEERGWVNRPTVTPCPRWHRERAPVSIVHLTDMGLKVTGVTGEAKLNVLRALKIITITKQGVMIV